MSVPLIDACSCAEFTNVVVRLAPFQFTTDPLTNPLPFTFSMKEVPPAVADEGDNEEMEGAGLLGGLMVKGKLPEVPPPGARLNTVTSAVPAAKISVALIAAWSCVALTKVVVRLAPFHFTTDPLMNPLPFTVRVKAALPAVADDGDNPLIDGDGLGACQPITVIVPPVAGMGDPVASAKAT